ncbi:MAG: hypothetical protein ABIS07_14675 [Dokdonella sp.]
MKSSFRAASIALFAAFASFAARAVEFVGSPGLLQANDALTWEQLGAAGGTVANPVIVTSLDARSAIVSQATGQANTTVAGPDFGPMYTQGERLYHTGNGFGFSGGPLTFQFARGINGFGVVCDPNFYLSGFAGAISAYDGDGVVLGTFPFSVSAEATYKQVFAGVAASAPVIRRVVIDGLQAAGYPEDFFVGTALIKADLLFADGFETNAAPRL